MAKQTTIKIISNDTNNNEMQKSIGYANPNASDYVLSQFGKKLNGLTTNTLKNVVRVDTEDITNATNE